MHRFIDRFRRDTRGATTIEYGLIVALFVVVILSALSALGGTSGGIINGAMNTLRTAMGG